MTNVVTDTGFLDRLYAAASRGVSAGERRDQRVSFVYGNMPEGSTLTKRQVADALRAFDSVDGATA